MAANEPNKPDIQKMLDKTLTKAGQPDVATSLSLSPHGFSLTLPGGLLFFVMLPHSRYQPLW